MKAKRMQKPIAKLARRRGSARCRIQVANGEREAPAVFRQRRRMGQPEMDQSGAGKVEHGEPIEGRAEPEVIGEAGGEEPAEEVARDVAGDVGREGAGRVHGVAMLAEIGEGEREGRGHAQPLRDPQQREGRKVRRRGEERGRNREQSETRQDAAAPVDAAAEIGDRKSGDRHAEGAGVDGKAHRGRRHPVGPGEGRQDRLRAEEVDHRQEGDEADEEGARERAASAVRRRQRGHRSGVAHVHCGSSVAVVPKERRPREAGVLDGRGASPAHIVCSSSCLSSWKRSAESSTAALLQLFFHQCWTPSFSIETSPALCSIGTAQLLAYSWIWPETT